MNEIVKAMLWEKIAIEFENLMISQPEKNHRSMIPCEDGLYANHAMEMTSFWLWLGEEERKANMHATMRKVEPMYWLILISYMSIVLLIYEGIFN